MIPVGKKLLGTALLMLIATIPSWSQPLPSSGAWVERLAGPAGIIFSGTVSRIERVPGEDGQPVALRVSFRVDEAVRGCMAGETIEIVEWAELWARADRYRKGERVILFLYPRNEAGLTSQVAGELGVVVVGPQGQLLFTRSRLLCWTRGPGCVLP